MSGYCENCVVRMCVGEAIIATEQSWPLLGIQVLDVIAWSSADCGVRLQVDCRVISMLQGMNPFCRGWESWKSLG